ncbi:DUF2599 domain-containing protein [Gordonia iterans]
MRRGGLTALGAGLAAVALLAGCGGDPAAPGDSSNSVSARESADRSSESAGRGSASPRWSSASPRRSSASPRRSSGVETPLPPPYIERAEWAQTQVGPSLQIYPTRAGRRVSGDGAADLAWREVLTLRPNADTPGMRAQFDCHWTFARIVDPEKTSWNLEPGRPVVSEEEMIASRCNPGFDEE